MHIKSGLSLQKHKYLETKSPALTHTVPVHNPEEET